MSEGSPWAGRTLPVDDLRNAELIQEPADHPEGTELLGNYLYDLLTELDVEARRLRTGPGPHNEHSSGQMVYPKGSRLRPQFLPLEPITSNWRESRGSKRSICEIRG